MKKRNKIHGLTLILMFFFWKKESNYEALLQKGKEQLKEVMASSRDFQSYVKFFGLLLKDAEKSKKKCKL